MSTWTLRVRAAADGNSLAWVSVVGLVVQSWPHRLHVPIYNLYIYIYIYRGLKVGALVRPKYVLDGYMEPLGA